MKSTAFFISLILSTFLSGAEASANSTSTDSRDNISGLWQHTEKPAQLKIDIASGLVTVYQHDAQPNAQGLTVIKHIRSSATDQASWQGQMYDGYNDKYVEVQMSLSGDNLLDVRNSEGKIVLQLKRILP